MFTNLTKKYPPNNRPFCLYGHSDCFLHDTGKEHPESRQRLEAIYSGIEGLASSVPLEFQTPEPAKVADLQIAHDLNYLMHLEESVLKEAEFFMSPDNPLSPGTLEAVLASAGQSLAAATHLTKGGSCFCLTRPPGHHAHRDRAEGFCFINHIALTIEKIRQTQPKARFLVVDIDVHHGNGIESLYKKDDGVFYFSLHGSPEHIYPGTGREEAPNFDKGRLAWRNITFELQTTGEVWLEAFEKNLKEIASECEPDFMLVSAGFDAHSEDPFSLLNLEDKHYHECFKLLVEAAHRYSQDRMGFFLEGGYSYDVLNRLVPQLIAQLAAHYNK